MRASLVLKNQFDDGWILIPLCEPSFHFLAELLDGRDASIQTLTVEDVQADFGDVEPTAALGCEMHVNLVCNPFGFLWREDFVQRSFLMRIQVIHDQGNGIRLRIVVIHNLITLITLVKKSSWSQTVETLSDMDKQAKYDKSEWFNTLHDSLWLRPEERMKQILSDGSYISEVDNVSWMLLVVRDVSLIIWRGKGWK